jgi:hypothetical protein
MSRRGCGLGELRGKLGGLLCSGESESIRWGGDGVNESSVGKNWRVWRKNSLLAAR